VLRSRIHGSVHPLPQYTFMAWCSVKNKKHWDNFTFTFTFIDGIVLMSILNNTNETEVEVEEPLVELEEIDFIHGVVHPCTNYADRERVILGQV